MDSKDYIKNTGFTPIKSGFTLIELLISIAIIGILTAFGTFAFQNAFGKARDAQRRNDLKQLQTALQAYYNDYGLYPIQPGWVGEGSNYGSNSTTYIPGLTPKYIRKLPSDPRAGKSNTSNIVSCTADLTGYIYRSTPDGSDYKVMAQCTIENAAALTNTNDALRDPAHPNQAWAIYSDGGANFN